MEGRAIDPGVWSQRKPAALVKLLALAPGHRLRREQVTAALWPEFEPAAAAANLRKTLHSARRILHSAEGAEFIVSSGDLLFLPPGGLSVDVGDYWSLVAEARGSRNVDAYAAAIAVYRYGLLPEDLYEEWAAAPREELNVDFLALVGEYAGLLEAGGNLIEAARAVQRLVAADQLGGYMAKVKPEFDKRGVKLMALSVDPVDRHAQWAADIEETQGAAPNYPMIGDADFVVSKAYGMLGADVSGDAADRTAAQNQTVRGVFVIGPDKKIKLILLYPMTTGRNFDEILRVIDSLQLTARHAVATPVNWRQGEDVVIAGSVSNDRAREVFGSWKEPKPYIRIVAQPA
ncbi:redoxin domain-containing protein [Dactylosporangium sp. McL0621]|uniref:redoxin domain-containing protein n=1 Tax=Dactylosporangium sp. McL0621 TaxID=3415678 RepID=UPI003CF11171